MSATAPHTARSRLPPSSDLLPLGGGLVVLAGLAAVAARFGGLAPLALGALALLLFWAASTPRFGLVAAVSAALLVPLPLSVTIAGVDLSAGRAAAFAFIAGWVASLSRADGPRLRWTGLEPAIVVLLGALGLSLAVNSPWLGDVAFVEGVRRIFVMAIDYVALLYAMVSVLAAGPRHIDRAVAIITGVVALVAALAVLELVTGSNVFLFLAPALPGEAAAYLRELAEAARETRGGLTRVQSTLTGPNQFGAVAVLGLPFLLHRALAGGRSGSLALAAAALTMFASLFTASRSVVIGIALSLGVYATSSSRVRRRGSAIGALAAVIVVVALTSPMLRATMSIYFQGLVGLEERSVSARVDDWENVLDQVRRTPVAGSGPGTWLTRSLMRGEAAGVGRRVAIDPADTFQTTLDNSFLQMTAETGLPGLAGLIALLAGGVTLATRALRRARDAHERSLAAACLASTVTFVMFCGFFDMFSFDAPVKLYLFVVAVTVVLAGSARPVHPATVPPLPARTLPGDVVDVTERLERPVPPEREAVDRADPVHLLATLRRRWLLPVIGLLVGAGLTAALVQAAPPAFHAERFVILDQPQVVATGNHGLAAVQKLGSLTATFSRVVQSDEVLTQARVRSGTAASVEDLRRRVWAEAVPDELTIRVRARAGSAEEARALATAASDALGEWISTHQRRNDVPNELRVQALPLTAAASVSAVDRNPVRTSALAGLFGMALFAGLGLLLEAGRARR